MNKENSTNNCPSFKLKHNRVLIIINCNINYTNLRVFTICDPPQDFNAKGESTRTTCFHFKTKEFILTRFSTRASQTKERVKVFKQKLRAKKHNTLSVFAKAHKAYYL